MNGNASDDVVKRICKNTLDTYKSHNLKSSEHKLEILGQFKSEVLYQLKLKKLSGDFIDSLYVDALISPYRTELSDYIDSL